MKSVLTLLLFILFSVSAYAEDGHHLWLRNTGSKPVNVCCAKNSPTLTLARHELQNGWMGEEGVKVTLTIKADKAIQQDVARWETDQRG